MFTGCDDEFISCVSKPPNNAPDTPLLLNKELIVSKIPAPVVPPVPEVDVVVKLDPVVNGLVSAVDKSTPVPDGIESYAIGIDVPPSDVVDPTFPTPRMLLVSTARGSNEVV